MSGGIYLMRGEDELVEMREAPYDAEDVLQALIAKFPSLLAGDQYPGETPRRWLLVGREASLPDDEDAGGRRAQRAFFDAFRDLAAPSFNLRVLRVPAPECDGAIAYERLTASLAALPQAGESAVLNLS